MKMSGTNSRVVRTLSVALCGVLITTALAVTPQRAAASSQTLPAARSSRLPAKRPAAKSKSMIESRLESLTRMLTLSDSQRSATKKILEDGDAQGRRLWNDQQLAPIDRMNKLRQLRQTSQDQFRALLTEDQRKKYDDYIQERIRLAKPQQASNAPASKPADASQHQ